MQPNANNDGCECRPDYVDDGSGKCVCPNSSMMFDADMNCIQIPLHCPAKGFKFSQPIKVLVTYTEKPEGKKILFVFMRSKAIDHLALFCVISLHLPEL